MGSGPSAHQPHHEMMSDHHQYPDMNMIFKGIPKMIQVADDMHRMTDYIMDLRNMTIGLVVISIIGVLGFLILRLIHGRRGGRSRRKRSFMRHEEDGYGHTSRYYYPSQYAPEPWERPKSTFSHHSVSQIDEIKKPLDSRNSPETKPNGTLAYKPFSNEDSISPDIEKKSEHSPPRLLNGPQKV